MLSVVEMSAVLGLLYLTWMTVLFGWEIWINVIRPLLVERGLVSPYMLDWTTSGRWAVQLLLISINFENKFLTEGDPSTHLKKVILSESIYLNSFQFFSEEILYIPSLADARMARISSSRSRLKIQIYRSISRRLVANGLHSCRPLRRLPLTPPNRRQRLEWCRARSMWMTEWHRVVFSDESRFCLSSDSRRVRVWRRRGERCNPAAIVERPTVRQRGIMVWGAIAYDSRSPLLRIQGTMTAQRYVDDVMRPVTLPYLQGVPNALYQQDNARPHTARISQQALQDVQMLPWPPYSPDLSPIEHVWDIIGRRLHALPQPRSEDELWQMVEREWRAIPQDAIRTLIDST
ncbi:hypothetical protein LAZ67_19001173 [Cordylochernes scorpioides]|uniref:Tc1-like transposase DDE domain-containing protein n=1 Tax=Cordylochernes scorpioides TaxID=51811 RepID=A0ABY6LHG7_9ARAC|nr:hypothetical protein LAZ67_19001173 [Cordylochernes scorpioides]